MWKQAAGWYKMGIGKKLYVLHAFFHFFLSSKADVWTVDCLSYSFNHCHCHIRGRPSSNFMSANVEYTYMKINAFFKNHQFQKHVYLYMQKKNLHKISFFAYRYGGVKALADEFANYAIIFPEEPFLPWNGLCPETMLFVLIFLWGAGLVICFALNPTYYCLFL